MANLDYIRNLANLIIADAKEAIPAKGTDECECQEDALESCLVKAEKILQALDD